jgi:transposase-like protein
MTTDERGVNRKLRILNHAEKSENIAKTCRYFGISRSLFYVWRTTCAPKQAASPVPPIDTHRASDDLSDDQLFITLR